MKRILLMALSFIFLLSVTALASEPNVYENPDYKFRITLPDDWSIQETGLKAHQLLESSPPAGFPKLAVFFTPNTLDDNNQNSKKLQEQFINQFLSRFQESFILKEKIHMTLANSKATRILLVDDKVYIINYFFKFNGHYVLIITMGELNNYKTDKEIINRSVSTFSKLEQIPSE